MIVGTNHQEFLLLFSDSYLLCSGSWGAFSHTSALFCFNAQMIILSYCHCCNASFVFENYFTSLCLIVRLKDTVIATVGTVKDWSNLRRLLVDENEKKRTDRECSNVSYDHRNVPNRWSDSAGNCSAHQSRFFLLGMLLIFSFVASDYSLSNSPHKVWLYERKIKAMLNGSPMLFIFTSILNEKIGVHLFDNAT